MHCAGTFKSLLDSTSLVLPIDDVENDERMSPKPTDRTSDQTKIFLRLCCECPFSFTVRLMVLYVSCRSYHGIF